MSTVTKNEEGAKCPTCGQNIYKLVEEKEKKECTGSGLFDVYITQGQGPGFDGSFRKLESALDYVEKYKKDGSFAIRLPDGQWHKWE